MAALVIYRDVPAQAVIDYGAGARDVAVQDIDGEAVDREPAAAVYPRPPRAGLRSRVSASRVVKLRGAASQLFRVELARVVIYPDVDIGVRARASHGAREPPSTTDSTPRTPANARAALSITLSADAIAGPPVRNFDKRVAQCARRRV